MRNLNSYNFSVKFFTLMMRESMKKDTTGFVNSLSVLYNTMMTTGIVAEING